MKTILVTGVTGHQGRALLRALQLRETSGPTADSFHVLGLTRTPDSAAANRIASAHPGLLTLVKGDLNDPQSIRRIFEDATKAGEGNGIWGVFCVLEFPGLGASTTGEERQGKALGDVALEYGVSLFVYSSAEHGAEYYDDPVALDGGAKAAIEQHIKALGQKGLPWTIIRPGFFMENYDGFIGAITVGVLEWGLKQTTTNRMVAADDIGGVAAAVFRDPNKYASQILVVCGEITTMAQQENAYRRATGKQLPAIPWLFARALLALNSHTRDLIADLERKHDAREAGKCSEIEAQAAAAKEAYPGMQTLEAWARSRGELEAGRGDDWNKVSLFGLLTGRQ